MPNVIEAYHIRHGRQWEREPGDWDQRKSSVSNMKRRWMNNARQWLVMDSGDDGMMKDGVIIGYDG